MNRSFPPPLSGDRTDRMAPVDFSMLEDLAGLTVPAPGHAEAKLLVSRIAPCRHPSGKRFSYQGYTTPAWN